MEFTVINASTNLLIYCTSGDKKFYVSSGHNGICTKIEIKFNKMNMGNLMRRKPKKHICKPNV